MRKGTNLLLVVVGVVVMAVTTWSCEKNYAPKIYDKGFARTSGLNSTTFVMWVDAKDANQDEINYLWEAATGEFEGNTDKNEATWIGPQNSQDTDYKIFITVSDGKDFLTDSIMLTIAAPTFGRLNGYAYFRDTKIPIFEAVVSMWGKSDSTNIKGEFEIDGIMAGRQTLSGSKEDFATNSIDMLMREGLNEANIHLTSTIHTTKLYGHLLGNITGEPKPYLTVIVLNPDFSESDLRTKSDGTGYYELPYVPHGLRYIKVKDETSVKMETIMYVDTPDRLFNVPIKEPFEFTDTRDNKSYKAVRIGGQIWMMENLAYLPQVDSAIATKGMWVYGYYGNNTEEAKDTYNYRTYGCLYEWSTAVADDHGNGRDICPPGWHLPTDDEFTSLEWNLGMSPIEKDSTGWILSGDVGKKLKAADGWDSDGNGTNSSSFTALPAGNRSTGKVFLGLVGYGTFWTATELDDEYAWRRYLYYNRDAIGRFTDFKANGYSVRCVQDR
ncbi:MAG: FISUMP domain-containing protein [Bacteroidota bacterium]|nr:FISUMP domain-containing protein [Bacteroidota bacterium]